MGVRNPRRRAPARLGLCLSGAVACLAFAWSPLSAQTADTLPAFKPDTVRVDPFRNVEAGPTPFTPSTGPAPKTRADSLAQTDTVTAKLRKRKAAISGYLGVDFIDLDAKETFANALTARLAKDTSLKTLQNYDPVHLAFPIGLQAVYPIGAYLDLVGKTHSYWYKQNAILGAKATSSFRTGDEWYASQANLGGLGLRYYVPPSVLSISGGLGLFAQGVAYWNLGGSELYTQYGTAPARFNPAGSAYEIMAGIQYALKGPWQLAGAIGFLQQDFESEKSWSDIIAFSPPPGKVHWASSSAQISINLWYHFGVSSDTSAQRKANASPIAPPVPVPVPSAQSAPSTTAPASPAVPGPSWLGPAAPSDTTRRR